MPTSADKRTWRPTEEQSRAIEATDRSMAVDAAAGSGKTSVLIRRILEILGGNWSRLEKILAITFTDKAAGELKARLRNHVPPGDRHLLEGAWIGTFHNFCARLLRRHAARIKADPSFGIVEENAAKLEARSCARETLLELLASGDDDAVRLVEAVEFKAALGAIENLMDFRLQAEAALSNRDGADGWESDVLSSLRSVYEKALSRYRAELARLPALDFQELEIMALKLLSVDGVRSSVSSKFEHILVDEFQDTNDVQTKLVFSLFAPGKNRLFIVGDEAQSIYRFRGANVGCFAEARNRIEAAGGESVRLSANFRSDPEIIGLVNSLHSVLGRDLLSKPARPGRVEPARTPSPPSRRQKHPPIVELQIGEAENASGRREEEAKALARFIGGVASDGAFGFGDVVMLFKALTASAIYEAALRKLGIPSIVSGGRGLLERQEVVDLMAALEYAANPDDNRALLCLLRSPIIGLSDDELAIMAGDGGKGLEAGVAGHPRSGIVAELPRLARHLRPSELMRRILDLSGYEAAADRIDTSGAMAANIDRFITVASSIERTLPVPLADFAAFIGELRAQSARLGDPPAAGDVTNAVRLMTVHAAKGLEFPVVVLPDLFHGESSHKDAWVFSRGGATGAVPGFAFKRRDPDRPFDRARKTERFKRILDEEKREGAMEAGRLLYVAMTRAMDMLVIPTHGDCKRAGPWHEWASSALAGPQDGNPFSVKRIDAGQMKKPALSHKTRMDRKLYRIPRGFSHRPSGAFTVSELEAYDSCPLRYRHGFVLGLPSRDIRSSSNDWVEKEVFG
nr:ATP-dependent helicase [bacterium]